MQCPLKIIYQRLTQLIENSKYLYSNMTNLMLWKKITIVI